MRGAPSIPTPDSQAPDSCLWDKEYNILVMNVEQLVHPRECHTTPAKDWHLTDTITESSKAFPPFYQANCFGKMRTMVNTVNSMSVSL